MQVMDARALLFVDDIALDEPDEPAGANHPCLGTKRRFPHRPQEMIFNSRVVKLSSAASVV
jgi:hypothetical protein